MSVQHRTDAHHSSDPGGAHITRLCDDLSLTLTTEQQPPGGEQDEGCEQIDDPLNAFDEGDAGGDRQRPEYKRAGDAKQKHATLMLGGNVQLGEDDDEDEDVVDRQRLLEQVRREIFRRGISTLRRSDPQPERQPQSNPHDDPRHVSRRRGTCIGAHVCIDMYISFRSLLPSGLAVVTPSKKSVACSTKSSAHQCPAPIRRAATCGVATGLAVTGVGGDVLFVEAASMPGKGGLLLTGQLGDVMKESARIVLTYVKSHARDLGIDEHAVDGREVHVHVPAGAIPKDGPSAGITMVTAIASLLTHRPVKGTIGMTGEVTLQGRVLPIGGLKQKVLAAHAAGLTEVIVPERNEPDLDEVPLDVREHMQFYPVTSVDEVLALALEPSVLAMVA